MNHHYELLYLASASQTEEELEPTKQKVRDAINKAEGNITFEDNFGKKKLAYPIEKNQQGYYLLTEFDLDGKNLANLDKDLRLTNEILRHIIVKRKATKQVNRLRLIDDAAAEVKTYGRTESRELKSKAPAPENKTSEETKVNLKDLDEKLDEILEGDIM